MTEEIFFDSDCLSAFLWVGNQSILAALYPGKIFIPESVYMELSNPCVKHLKCRIDMLLNSGYASIQSIEVGSPAYSIFQELTSSADQKQIGNGEAACIALAKTKNGIIASNNLMDVDSYVRRYSLKHITTGDILCEALARGIITEEQGNDIWWKMLSKRRKLGAESFTEYLADHPLPSFA